MAVPNMHPAKAQARCSGITATAKPCHSAANASIGKLSQCVAACQAVWGHVDRGKKEARNSGEARHTPAL